MQVYETRDQVDIKSMKNGDVVLIAGDGFDDLHFAIRYADGKVFVNAYEENGTYPLFTWTRGMKAPNAS